MSHPLDWHGDHFAAECDGMCKEVRVSDHKLSKVDLLAEVDRLRTQLAQIDQANSTLSGQNTELADQLRETQDRLDQSLSAGVRTEAKLAAMNSTHLACGWCRRLHEEALARLDAADVKL